MLEIKREFLHSIFEHCNAAFPNETCGILAGRYSRVEIVYSMTNAKPGPTYYEMHPGEQFRVMKDIRDKGLAMVGIYHSHPSGPAYPSRVDVEKAYWPGTLYPNYPDAVYMIVSLMDRLKPIAKVFSIVEGTVTEVRLSLI
jgi:proteasome lid subunit RPN8/RPN11